MRWRDTDLQYRTEQRKYMGPDARRRRSRLRHVGRRPHDHRP